MQIEGAIGHTGAKVRLATEMIRPPHVDIESAFDAVVAQLGGHRVEELVGKSPGFANADYVIEAERVVLELKCLEKDQLSEFPTKLMELFNGWVRGGRVPPPPPGTSRIESSTLPMDCQLEIVKLYRDPIVKVIKKANRQLRETKQALKMGEAQGVLLLANDGNTLLEANMAMYVLATAFQAGDPAKARYTSIQRVVYFTANMPSRMPGLDREAMIWATPLLDSTDESLSPLLATLGRTWIEEYEKHIGEEVPRIVSDPAGLDEIRIRRPWD